MIFTRLKVRGLLVKSLDRLELIALIREVAVEIIAAKIAHPTTAPIHGVVVAVIAVINTLPP